MPVYSPREETAVGHSHRDMASVLSSEKAFLDSIRFYLFEPRGNEIDKDTWKVLKNYIKMHTHFELLFL